MKCLPLAAIIAVLCGCSRHVEIDEIPGRYAIAINKDIDLIDVLPNGTYRYYYKNDSGVEIRNAGKWSVDYIDGVQRLTFWRFIFGYSSWRKDSPGIWSVEMEHSWRGRIRLCLDADMGKYYEKTDSAITMPLVPSRSLPPSLSHVLFPSPWRGCSRRELKQHGPGGCVRRGRSCTVC